MSNSRGIRISGWILAAVLGLLAVPQVVLVVALVRGVDVSAPAIAVLLAVHKGPFVDAVVG